MTRYLISSTINVNDSKNDETRTDVDNITKEFEKSSYSSRKIQKLLHAYIQKSNG